MIIDPFIGEVDIIAGCVRVYKEVDALADRLEAAWMLERSEMRPAYT
jgi:hypothetical protein